MGGHLVSIQKQFIRSCAGCRVRIRAMRSGRLKLSPARELLLSFPAGFKIWPEEKKRSFLFDMLNRPIRVCGVVPNAGEPGGAPFWVEDENGDLSVQIIEKAQVDLNSSEQSAIWNLSTHFNPVDIVCCARDFEGKPHDLRKFVDPRRS